jgi:chromosome segregation ATPase
MDDMTGNPPRTDQPHVGGQDASDERIGSAADSDWAVAQLAVLRGEAKGLLAANEMAEKACTVLREELRLSRLDRTEQEGRLANMERSLGDANARAAQAERRAADVQAHLTDTQSELRDTQARLAATQAELSEMRTRLDHAQSLLSDALYRLENTLNSHSWRVTAPIRRVSAILLRRS